MRKTRLCCLMLVTALLLASVGALPVLAEKQEPVTLRMFIRNQSKYTGLQEDPVAKYVEEKLGIRMELTVDVSLGNTTAQTSTFNELLAAKLASGDLDDIMDFGSTTGNPEIVANLVKAAEAGMIIPLDDLIANHTKNLNSDPRLTIRNEFRKKYMYPDSKQYSVGGWGGMGIDQLPGAADWVRWDLYKQLGYPEIKTDDDFLDVIQKMVELFPETPNGVKVYGIGGKFADPQGMGDGVFNRDYPMVKGYEPIEGNYAVYFDHANREVVAPLSDPDSFFWNGVKFYFKANQRGLLDPAAMTMGNAEFEEKFKQGAYVATHNGWLANNKEGLLESLGIPDAGFMPTRMQDDVKSLAIYWELLTAGNDFAISSKCKYPEKAIEFLDWCNSDEGSRILTQGAEGVAWEMKDGQPVLTEAYTADNKAGTVDMAEAYGKWKYAGINAFQHIDFDKGGTYIMPEQIPHPEEYSVVKKDALKHYGAPSFTDFFTNYVNRSGEKLPAVIWATYQSGIGPKPDDIKQKYAQINDYMFRAVFKMVYAQDEAEFDAIKAETMQAVKDLGEPEVVQWYKDRFVTLHEQLDPLVEAGKQAYGVK